MSVKEIIGMSKAKVAKALMAGDLCLLSETNKVCLNVIAVPYEVPPTVYEDVVFPRSTRNTFRSSRSSNTQNRYLTVVS